MANSALNWEADHVTTRDGVVIPVRQTARRPTWETQPTSFRALVEAAAGSAVVGARSAGSGYTPGFASKLSLADGRSIFVKAASSADDERHGWKLSQSYRDEVKNLVALPAGIGSPELLWSRDQEVDGLQWIVLGFEYVNGTPPRRPWRQDELDLACAKIATIASRLREPVPSLQLDTVAAVLCDNLGDQLAEASALNGASPWLETVGRLCDGVEEILAGDSITHLDLRDDNILIDAAGEVWVVDWNWPAVGAPWIDLITVLIAAAGDGLDVDAILRRNPLTVDLPPSHIDQTLALLWVFWSIARHQPVPHASPHLRDHQLWYADATRGWLERRLASRG